MVPIMGTGLVSNPQDHSYGGFYSEEYDFLSELMLRNMEFWIYCVVVNGDYVDDSSPSKD